jgi:hypothetical protein
MFFLPSFVVSHFFLYQYHYHKTAINVNEPEGVHGLLSSDKFKDGEGGDMICGTPSCAMWAVKWGCETGSKSKQHMDNDNLVGEDSN